MAQIKVDRIVDRSDASGPEFTKGATIPAGQLIDGSGGINVSGIVTASSFAGNGTGLTNLSIATQGKAIALKLIIADPPLRS